MKSSKINLKKNTENTKNNNFILVIGGSDKISYRQKYNTKHIIEIGNHRFADFGYALDKNNKSILSWLEPNFWEYFDKCMEHNNIKFNAIMIDSGSESWVNDIFKRDTKEIMYSVLFKHLTDDGIILVENLFKGIFNFLYYVKELHKIGTFRYNQKYANYNCDYVFNILSKSKNIDDSVLKNNKMNIYNIYEKQQDIYDIMYEIEEYTYINNVRYINKKYDYGLGYIMKEGYYEFSNNFKPVYEVNNIDFLLNRIFNEKIQI